MADKVLTVGAVSGAITVIGGWMWVTAYFVTQADADSAHGMFKHDLRETYLELKIDQANTEMAFIEQAGIAVAEERAHSLLKFSVERMTQQLLELDK
jgi:hypothetical protein